ncbi:hypothetical protein KIH27_03080 [Mycobacterium sp. M1]|uniref:Lipoprotein LpqJ n=1 Tax=Mycolicibacter acidiphilus TaxID=2835306 RepID=A0ABS5RE56_9MYCO|nr:hypothetical protein [Mycolicibacter acidiphilus]MBS9532567.1 hypothetical protein [Mycolicibacter acidiphilus]
MTVVLPATAVLVGGCSHTTDGTPVAGPTTPATSTSSVPAPTTPTTPPAHPRQPGRPSDAVPLLPNADGYVFIETKSGRTRCQISPDTVGCEAEFTNSPLRDGEHANGVNITSTGTISWILGNLGNIPAVTIDYLTYQAQGWTIAATVDGTRFTNDRTGHGMFVSIDDVTAF